MSGTAVRDGRGAPAEGKVTWFDGDVLDRYGRYIGPHGIAVYWCICRHADASGVCHASQPALARQLGLSRRCVHANLCTLVACGLIASEGQWDERAGRRENRYTILAPEARIDPAGVFPSPRLTGGWEADRQRVIQRDGLFCGICGGPVPPDDVHIDHIMPRSMGGTDAPTNLRVTHSRCNIRRGNRP